MSLPLSSVKLVPLARPGSEENWTLPLDVGAAHAYRRDETSARHLGDFLPQASLRNVPNSHHQLVTTRSLRLHEFSQLTFTTIHMKIGILFSLY